MFPFTAPAIKIEQPLGIFYIVSLPASLLLETCHSIKTEVLEDLEEDAYHPIGKIFDRIKGTQRERKKSRLEEIKRYSETVDACFPNSIILGANYDELGRLESNSELKWSVEAFDDNFYYLTIPTKAKLASIIDGQHRVFGFKDSSAKNMSLLCSVFIDLPMAYHAQIFTKINTTQKRVDKNLAYNLFQFDMAQGDSNTWSPETLSVYFSRVLAEDNESPLKGMIKLGVSGSRTETSISMASVVDGILSLITSNPEIDRNKMHAVALEDGRDRSLLKDINSNAPLRGLFLHKKDRTLYNIINDYLTAVTKQIWKGRGQDSIFRKTLGIQACFDVLKELAKKENNKTDLNFDYFYDLMRNSNNIDFNVEFFGVQSKVRARIKNTLLVSFGIKDIDELRCSREDKERIKEITAC
ncbi:DGQHR domain-containing protein [Nitrincola sp.]|uniref:DGQHR domain-containing protein n=1 Tax=Nitrincola sp. TaxID=1926584 RepID=UPI003A91E883